MSSLRASCSRSHRARSTHSRTECVDRPYPDADAAAPLLLASYSDGPNCDFWRELANLRPAPDEEAYDSPTRWNMYAASPQLMEAQRQLALLHDRDDLPDPVASLFIDWASRTAPGMCGTPALHPGR
jgi:hypothetical protein